MATSLAASKSSQLGSGPRCASDPRKLCRTGGILFVRDGGKARRCAVKDVFGEQALVQRCRIHKERGVLDHLPEREHGWVRGKLRRAWANPDADEATGTSRHSPVSWRSSTRTPPAASARAWPRCSPSPAWA